MRKNPAIPTCFNFKEGHEYYPRLLREYVDWGVSTFFFSADDVAAAAIFNDTERIPFMKNLCKELHISFPGMHAPYGREYDLNIPPEEDRERMIQIHIKGLQCAAEFGCTTYTMHIGAWYSVFKHVPVEESRPRAIQTLERLVPEAEKLGVIIAVENSFEMPNSAKEVLKIIDPFLPSPAIGVCYDTGHAHIMEPFPGKKMENYGEDMAKTTWWGPEGIVLEANALEMLQPHVVTCHIHDNNGYADQHAMPGYGNLDFHALMPKLFACPRMLSYQTELCFEWGRNWAGKLPAPWGGYSVKEQVETYRQLGL